jgi:chitinase
MIKFTKTLAAAAALAALMPSAAQAATAVAPYFEAWAYWGGYTPTTLMEAKNNGGVMGATMAFGISGGGCTLGGGLENLMSGSGLADITAFQAAGGKPILSFGGASGTYLEAACSEDAMVTLIRSIIDTTKVKALDFDIEGSQLGNTSLNSRRNAVIKRLQATYPGLYVSFTLPVDPWGLPDDAMTLLRSAQSAGVSTSVVNIMAMDYGRDADQGRPMGDLAIMAANATFNQIKGIYTGKTDAQLWAMVGITPMIGVNDVQSEVFRQSDATQVTAFAKEKGLGLLAYWALQRDMPGGTDYNNYSLVNDYPYEFYKLMSSGGGGGPVKDGRYLVKSSSSGKCFEVEGGSRDDSAQIVQMSCHSVGKQRFDVKDMGGGNYRLLNQRSAKAIDIAAASNADGAKVQQYTDNGTGAQRFSFVPTGVAGEYTIVNQHSGKCLDVADKSQQDGAKIQQWTCSNGSNQKFRLKKQ